ncbi:aspartyl-tRNA synthetase, archaeal-type, partial [Kipferlia bialata]|eukprot:g11122.t1
MSTEEKVEVPAEAPMSKKAIKKAAKEAAKKAAREEREAAKKAAEAEAFKKAVIQLTDDNVTTAQFGDAPFHKSQYTFDRTVTHICDLPAAEVGSSVWIRARLHNTRSTGKSAFLVAREKMDTVQCIGFLDETHPKAMFDYIKTVPKESIVEIQGTIQKPAEPITSTTLSHIELNITKFITLNRSNTVLPLEVEDAARPDSMYTEGCKFVRPGQATRLDNRVIDLRTPANQAIFRVRSRVCRAFRRFLDEQGFMEIQSPKLIGGASEGGSAVFHVDYFGT